MWEKYTDGTVYFVYVLVRACVLVTCAISQTQTNKHGMIALKKHKRCSHPYLLAEDTHVFGPVSIADAVLTLVAEYCNTWLSEYFIYKKSTMALLWVLEMVQW